MTPTQKWYEKIEGTRWAALILIVSFEISVYAGLQQILAKVGWLGIISWTILMIFAIAWPLGFHKNMIWGCIWIAAAAGFGLYLYSENALPFMTPPPLNPAYVDLVRQYDESGNLMPEQGQPGEVFATEGVEDQVSVCLLGQQLPRALLTVGKLDNATGAISNRLDLNPTTPFEFRATEGEQLWCFTITVASRKPGIYVLELTPDRENIAGFPPVQVGKLLIRPKVGTISAPVVVASPTATVIPTDPFATPTLTPTPVP